MATWLTKLSFSLNNQQNDTKRNFYAQGNCVNMSTNNCNANDPNFVSMQQIVS